MKRRHVALLFLALLALAAIGAVLRPVLSHRGLS
jgi:hypothetical protein